MLRYVVQSALKHRRTVLALALVVILAGGWQLRHANVDALPELNPPTVEVQTQALGLSAEEVEQYVTVPLEQNFLNGVSFLDTISSRSLPGVSSVLLTFKRGTDLFTARQLVQERLSLTTELPNVSKPPQMLQPESSTSRVMMIGLSSKKLSALELSVLARWTIRPRLLGVPGVADVDIWGQRDQRLQVQVDPRRLATQGVALDSVVATTGDALFVSPLTFLQASTPGSGGFLDTANQRLSVQHILPIRTPADLGQVSVTGTSPPLKLSDVATVVQDHQPLIGDTVLPDTPGLMLVVQRLPGANTRTVTHALDAALSALRPGLNGVTVDASVYRPASYLDSALHNLGLVTVASLLILAVMLWLVAGWRAAIAGALSTTASVTAAALVLSWRGVALNSLVVVGLVVAAAPIVIDVVALARPETDPSAAGRVRAGRMSAYATVISIVAVTPVLVLSDLPARAFVLPMLLSFGLAMLIGLAVVLLVAPAVAATTGTATPARPAATLIATRVATAHTAVLRTWRAASSRVGAVALVALVVVAGFGAIAIARLAPSLTPSLREGEVLIPFDGPPGTSLPEMTRIVGRAEAELRGISGVRDVGAHVGRAAGSDQVVDTSSSELWVNLSAGAARDRVVEQIRDVVNGYPGLSHPVLSYFAQRLGEVQQADPQQSGGPPVIIRLQGEDFAVLQSKAAEVQKLLAAIPGVVHPQIEQQLYEPVIDVSVNLDAAQKVGIKPGDIRRAASTLVSGIEVGSLYQDQKVFQVVVWGSPNSRNSLTDVQDLLIDTPTGGHVRLGDVASVQIRPSLTVIKHTDVSRSLDVTATVKGRSVSAVLSDVRRKVGGVAFPLAYNARVLGGSASHTSTYRLLFAAIAIGALLILLLLQAALASWRAAAVVLGAVALSLVGGLLAAWAAGGTVSLGAVAGLFAVGVISVRGALAMAERSDTNPGAAALVLAGLVTVALVLVPAVVGGTRAGTELLHPAAIVMLGGLVSSALMTMVAVPMLIGGRSE